MTDIGTVSSIHAHAHAHVLNVGRVKRSLYTIHPSFNPSELYQNICAAMNGYDELYENFPDARSFK